MYEKMHEMDDMLSEFILWILLYQCRGNIPQLPMAIIESEMELMVLIDWLNNNWIKPCS